MGRTKDEVLRATRSPALDAAVERLRAGIAELGTGRDFDVRTVGERLQLLADVIEGADPPEFSNFSSPEILLFAQLLQGLRGELLAAEATSEEDAREILALLVAIEATYDQLQRGSPHASFLNIWTALRGPELMVELAHDLRSPLTSILFLAETLRSGQSGPLTDLQHEQLGIIYSAAMTVVTMAADVIELARGDDVLIEKEPADYSVADLLGAIAQLVSPMVETKQVELRTRGPRKDLRRGYPAALSRTLLNLTNNSIRFTEQGYVELAANEVAPGRIEFSVTDTGRGIAPESLDHLFEPFRAHPARDRIGISGAGLGLAICRRLVRAMGGELDFESTPGEGTRFFFTVEAPAAD